MAVTKEMLDKELQSFYRKGRLFTWGVRQVWWMNIVRFLMNTFLKGQQLKGYHNDEEHYISSSHSNRKIRVRIFRPKGCSENEVLPAMIHFHAGGYLMGMPEMAFPFYQQILQRRDVVIVAPDYCLSPQEPYPAAFQDSYDTLLWMKNHAKELNICDNKFIVAGHSAGGGLAAAVAIKARDSQDADIAFQMPFYPMLDHRMITNSSQTMDGAPLWDSKGNKYGWEQYLRGIDTEEVPVYASPALNTNFEGLPPTISFVGELDPFLDEDITYMESLKRAGVPTKFCVFPKAYHAFDDQSPKATISKEATAFMLDAFEEYMDRYVVNK